LPRSWLNQLTQLLVTPCQINLSHNLEVLQKTMKLP
jgi:hypothetical protein